MPRDTTVFSDDLALKALRKVVLKSKIVIGQSQVLTLFVNHSFRMKEKQSFFGTIAAYPKSS
jgi:hypothetical protein